MQLPICNMCSLTAVHIPSSEAYPSLDWGELSSLLQLVHRHVPSAGILYGPWV